MEGPFADYVSGERILEALAAKKGEAKSDDDDDENESKAFKLRFKDPKLSDTLYFSVQFTTGDNPNDLKSKHFRLEEKETVMDLKSKLTRGGYHGAADKKKLVLYRPPLFNIKVIFRDTEFDGERSVSAAIPAEIEKFTDYHSGTDILKKLKGLRAKVMNWLEEGYKLQTEIVKDTEEATEYHDHLKKMAEEDQKWVFLRDRFQHIIESKDVWDLDKLEKEDPEEQDKFLDRVKWQDLIFEKEARKHMPTFYYQDEDEGTDICRKRFPLPMKQPLGDFKKVLRLNLRSEAVTDDKGDDTTLILNYVEDIPEESYFSFEKCICRICGNEEPKTLKIKELPDEEFLNAHALEMFFSNASTKDDLCTECSYFQNLDINIDRSNEIQTRSQPYLVVTGIFLSPAFWILLSLPLDKDWLMLLSCIAIIASSLIGLCIMCYGLTPEKKKKEEVEEEEDTEVGHDGRQPSLGSIRSMSTGLEFFTERGTSAADFLKKNAQKVQSRLEGDYGATKDSRIEKWFKDPYNLVHLNYMYYMLVALIVLNVLNVAELLYIYTEDDLDNFNAPHECTLVEGITTGFTENCVIYYELMGASTTVLLCMLFINVAVIRRPKERVNFKKHGESEAHSMEALKELANNCEEPGVKEYYKYALDVIAEVRQSTAPTRMPSSWTKVKIGKKYRWVPTLKTLGVIVIQIIFVICLTMVSMVTHREQYIDKLTYGYGSLYIFPVGLGYIIAVFFLRLYYMTMFKVTMVFGKAYALMKILSDPLHFIANLPEEKRKPRTPKKETDSGIPDPSPLEPQKTIAGKTIQSNTVLDEKLQIVTPQFLTAWISLREHVQKWEVGYFYELTQPIVSLEIVFVVAVLGMGLVFVFQEPYDGDVREYLSDMVAKSNVVMILVLFLILVIVTLLSHLNALLRPYTVQQQHESWLDGVAESLQTEEANMYRLVVERMMKADQMISEERKHRKSVIGKQDKEAAASAEVQAEAELQDDEAETLVANAEYLAKTRELLLSMRKEMSENRTAPKLLGVLTLNETLIESIIGSITAALTTMFCAFFSGLMSEIADATIGTDTTTTTMSPTTA